MCDWYLQKLKLVLMVMAVANPYEGKKNSQIVVVYENKQTIQSQ